MNEPMDFTLNGIMNAERQAIRPMSFSEPFWEATKEKKLVLQYCPETDQYQFFPRPMSLYTGKRNVEWREVSGEGELYSHTIARRSRPPYQGHEPFAVGLVTLDAGVNVIGNLINLEEEDIKVGMRLKPYWYPLPEGHHLLMFEPNGS